ncbi:hypothetical protein QL285_062901 [Trifolium repens]|nr:hypothetical protein QL285_062901 [Trifolium repens]
MRQGERLDNIDPLWASTATRPWDPPLAQAAILLAGTVDYNVQKVYNELPQWGESFSQARARYQQTIKELADKYPTENLLFLTHGEALQTALSSTRKDGVNAKLQYCAYVELRRPIFNKRR